MNSLFEGQRLANILASLFRDQVLKLIDPNMTLVF
jgi:hypothetical protein